MTRIIAGRHGGRPLKVPDAGTRPTSDRVREAVFNILDARIDLEGAAILDLYAGSGALGLEALSRGASSAVFVDNRRRATAVVTANLRALGVAEVGRVITAPVSAFSSSSTARATSSRPACGCWRNASAKRRASWPRWRMKSKRAWKAATRWRWKAPRR